MINLETKGGTNQFHGNLREYNRNTLLEANDWFNNRDGIPRTPLVRNQFGGSVGGPIRKDKVFFFFDYEGFRDSQSVSYNRAVPTAQFRSGELAYVNNTTNPAYGTAVRRHGPVEHRSNVHKFPKPEPNCGS